MPGTQIEFVDIDLTDHKLSLAVLVDGNRFDVWFRASVPLFLERGDALLALGLLPAMRTRTPLIVPRPVSERLVRNVGRLQDILASFSDGALARTRVVADKAPNSTTSARGVGSFFSGGVDSFYTALKHEAELSHLVFVHGLDVFDATSPRAAAAAHTARASAHELGKELIEVETNVRELTTRFGTEIIHQGPSLAVIALLLQSELTRIMIPSTFAYAVLCPWGQHPLVDPLWGTEGLEFVHDGCEANRLQKIARIATSDTALRHLRVCNSQHATLNCGECRKCVFCMVGLRRTGALERCTTLPNTVSAARVAAFQVPNPAATAFARENLTAARQARDWPMALAFLVGLRPRPFLAVRRGLGRLRRARSRPSAGVRG